MSISQDWLMRQIETYVELLARVLFQKEKIEYVILDRDCLNATDELSLRLRVLIAEHRFGEAENELYECYEPGNEAHMKLALDFYGKLNALPDEMLEEHDFPREEIEEGLQGLMRRSGVSLNGLDG